MKLFPTRHRTLTPAEEGRLELEESLHDAQLRIAQAYAGFNTATDPDLVESFVYEIQAQKVRYSYLLRRRKALEEHPLPQPDALGVN